MKTETRVSGLSPRPSSAGGTTLVMWEILPSAGAIMKSSFTGVTRGGSRKNQAHQVVNTKPIQNNGDHKKPKITETTKKAAMNLYPSGWMGIKALRMDDVIDMTFRVSL